MPNFTITISDTDKLALDTVINPHHLGIGTWTQNVISERARLAKIDIVDNLIVYCNENSIQMAVGMDAQVQQAYSVGIASTLPPNDDTPPG
tara:strand:- start:314 stop:586 length:273 start_codon:yes stop_codon:yes gene_type:complete